MNCWPHKGIIKALTSAIGTEVLFLNELLTLMKETQQLANERPIGIKPNLNTDPEYLSPNSLLLGRCSERISQGPFWFRLICKLFQTREKIESSLETKFIFNLLLKVMLERMPVSIIKFVQYLCLFAEN